MSFALHPSTVLVELFKQRPYQGQQPELAKIIFLSSDANYSPEISAHSFFKKILEYHEDGVRFWEKYNVHHPFLLPAYPFKKNQGGVPFHKRFTAIGLDTPYAKKICFLELLDVPTIGSMSKNKKLFWDMLNLSHAKYLDDLITSDSSQLFLISKNVLDMMFQIQKKYRIFTWLDSSIQKVGDSMQVGSNKFMVIYHFSASVSNNYRASLKQEIDLFANLNKS